jgi:hypothetical protein
LECPLRPPREKKSVKDKVDRSNVPAAGQVITKLIQANNREVPAWSVFLPCPGLRTR